jgi:predicted metal-binding membrane protein
MQTAPRRPTLLEAALRRDRYIVLAGLAAITLLAWAYLFYVAPNMSGMDSLGELGTMAMSGMSVGFGPVDIMLMFLMWAVMMVGMMVPSAAPMILTFANINRRGREQGNPYVPTAVFLSGYLLVWVGFSVAATLAQIALIFAILGSSNLDSALMGGLLLLAAGAFQLSPLKNVCLRHCRTPMGFITNDWREGGGGALLMGLHHGGYCLGCCWALMGLLFLLGVMNLLWIAALAAFVLVEKVGPAGVWVGRAAGVCLLAWGTWLLSGVLL